MDMRPITVRLRELATRDRLEAADRIAALEAQLPAEMQDCTIRFIECEKGHGRLTATNWVQQPCHYCRIKALEAALLEIAEGSPIPIMTARAALAPEQDK